MNDTRGQEEIRPQEETAEMGELACRVTNELLQLMGLSAKAEYKGIERERIIVDISGDDSEQVIGKGGNTLDALQFLASVMVGRKTNQRCPLTLDSGGYGARREAALVSAAKDLAAQVKSRGEEAVLDGLRPHERRIVHMALRDDKEVHTYSEGEEPDRHVIISPRD